MKKIKEGIVFSYDIKRILEGNNSLKFNYEKNGIKIPNDSFIENLRENFFYETSKIFDNKVVIIKEEEMIEEKNNLIRNIEGIYPHCIIR